MAKIAARVTRMRRVVSVVFIAQRIYTGVFVIVAYIY